MTRDVLDQNLEKLLAIAPPRERLSDVARARIQRVLLAEFMDEAAVSTSRVPGLRLVPVLSAAVAVAAALTLVVLGAWRWLDPRGPAAGTAGDDAIDRRVAEMVRPGPAGEGATTDPAPESPKDLNGDFTVRSGDDSGRDPLVADVAPGASNAETDQRAETEGAESTPGLERGGAHVLATLSIKLDPANTSTETTPSAAGALDVILWVKPMVQLPRVADPLPHPVQVTFAPADDGSGWTALLEARNALKAAVASGSEQVLLQVEMPGYAPARTRVSPEQAAAGTLRFELDAGLSLSGVVLDETNGTPVPGAVVVAMDQLPLDALDVAVDPARTPLPRPFTVADGLGRFTLDHVAADTTIRLRASSPGFAPTVLSVDAEARLEAGSASGLELELSKGSTVVGLVDRPDGTPWEGAYVVVSKQEVDPARMDRPVMTFGAGTCDFRGEFRVPGLPAGQYVALLFDPDGPRVPLELRQVRLDGKSEARIDFRAPAAVTGVTLTGTLTDTEGRPRSRASLTLASVDGDLATEGEWRVTETDAAGTFQFSGIPPSMYTIYLASDGFGQMILAWEGQVSDSQELKLTLPATEVTLAAAGASGNGESWVILERWRPESSEWFYAGRKATESNEGHRDARISNLLPGRYRAVIVGPGHGATWTEPFELEVERPSNTALTLRPGGPLTIRAVDENTGTAIAGRTVTVEGPDGLPVPQQEAVRTDSAGRAVILSVPYGDITVRFRAPAGSSEPAQVETLTFDAFAGTVECRIERR